MRNLKVLFLIVLIATPAWAAKIDSGEAVIAAMHKRYDGKWYKTLTFVQKTITHKPDGTSESETWYEALNAPGKLRIDFDPVEKGNGILFADGKLYSFREGKLAGSRPFTHPLLVLGFDIYLQNVETSVSQIKAMNIDMSIVHEGRWQGRAVYVVGAKQGDLKTPQFWIDKKELYFVRLIELTGKDKTSVHETQFNKYQKVKSGGWVAAEVEFFVDGRRTTSEEYTDIQAGMPLSADLWDPEKWMTVDHSYFKKK